MKKQLLKQDPFNLIITGVGGQGNVMASRMLGQMLAESGYQVTIGETFGASQRGGSVMSHLRISSHACFSPQIPKGRAHMVVALEPSETLRVLAQFGNPEISVICNTRPIYSVGVISGDQTYPEMEALQQSVSELAAKSWFINATDIALDRMKQPIYGNIILIGALAATGYLPIERERFESIAAKTMSPEKVALNLTAFDIGAESIH